MSAEVAAPKRRVSFALGTWQLVVLLACLDQVDASGAPPEQDHLVLYGPALPERMRVAMDTLAASGRSWTSVTWADDVLLKPTRPGSGESGAIAALRDRLGFDAADEIWVCKLFDFPEKVAAEALPGARIQLYEDGMHFYVPQPTIRGRMHDVAEVRRSFTRRTTRWVLGRGDAWWSPGVWDAHTQRLAGCWAVLPAASGLPAPPPASLHRHVDGARIRAQLGAMTRLAGTAGDASGHGGASDRPLAIVLGQAYARFHILSTERESEIYTNVCRDLLDKGFAVLWKDHPRLEQGYGQQLFAELAGRGSIGPLRIGSEWPVEAAVAELQPAALVSATSTALFVCAALFDTACYSFADELGISRLRRDHSWMARLAMASFPSPREVRRAVEGAVRPGAAS